MAFPKYLYVVVPLLLKRGELQFGADLAPADKLNAELQIMMQWVCDSMDGWKHNMLHILCITKRLSACTHAPYEIMRQKIRSACEICGAAIYLQREDSLSSSMQPPGFSFQWLKTITARESPVKPVCLWGNPHHYLCCVSAEEESYPLGEIPEVSNGLMWKGKVRWLGYIWIKTAGHQINI